MTVARPDQRVVTALGAFRQGEDTQVLLERTLGRALLEKLEGKDANLLAVYQGLGGHDPGVAHVLSGAVSEAFKKLNVDAGAKAVRAATSSTDLAKVTKPKAGAGSVSKNSRLEAREVLAEVPGQVLNTFVSLGGSV